MLLINFIHGFVLYNEVAKQIITFGESYYLTLNLSGSDETELTLKNGRGSEGKLQFVTVAKRNHVFDIKGRNTDLIHYSNHGGSNQQWEIALGQDNNFFIINGKKCLMWNEDKNKLMIGECHTGYMTSWRIFYPLNDQGFEFDDSNQGHYTSERRRILLRAQDRAESRRMRGSSSSSSFSSSTSESSSSDSSSSDHCDNQGGDDRSTGSFGDYLFDSTNYFRNISNSGFSNDLY